ncbi:MAG TPA: DUF3179 domain-containing (seleno)protein [Chryseosolibacter sp.]
MLKTVQFIIGMLLLIALEIFKVYFIMPFPGSQRSETVDLAYFIHGNIFWFRTIGYLIILFPIIHFFTVGKTPSRVLVSLSLVLYGVVFYFFNFKFLAEKMFYQPENKIFAVSSQSRVPLDRLVVGVSHNGESKAYPIEIIGYHHQVRDTVGGKAVMVTYCTVCRTGRVFSPEVDGKVENFRLVGMDHFNAMFEDESTKSWWRQVSGEAIAGPRKGEVLQELFSEQMSLRAWLALHPASQIMQPDTVFQKDYDDLQGFDKGTIKSGLEKRDSLSWKEKSWVVGVQQGMTARAYDWNDLIRERVINDTLNAIPIVIVLEDDSATFRVFRRDSLEFEMRAQKLVDKQTGSDWSWAGQSTSGTLAGKTLPLVQSYQEFWHSWKTFHPQTSQFRLEEK